MLALAATAVFLLAAAFAGVELLRGAFTGDDGGWSLDPLVRTFTQRYMLLGPLWHSLLLGLACALLATALGAVLAWLAARSDMPGALALFPFIALPHVIPGFQLASAWVEVFTHGGLWEGLGLGASPLGAYGSLAIVAVLVLHLYLFAYLGVAAALASADPALEEAARVAGLGPRRVFLRITLPLAGPALLASLLLVFAYVMEEFGVPSLLGTPSGFDTLTTRIYGLATSPPLDLGGASVLALVLGLVALAVLVGQKRLAGARSVVSIGGKASVRNRIALGRWRWPLAALAWAFVLATALVPLVALALVSCLDSWGRGWGPGNWTLARHAALLRDAELRRALFNSLGLALASAGACTLLALTIVYAGERLRRRWARLADRVSFVAFALPGLVIGLALILAFGGGLFNLYGSFGLLLLAYVLRFLGIPVRGISARLAQLAPELEAAGEIAGLTRMRIVLRIVVPLLAPAAVGGFVLTFINSVKEISATSLLATQGHETLAYEAYLRFQEGNYTQGSVVSLWMIALVLAVMGLGRLAGGRRAGRETRQ